MVTRGVVFHSTSRIDRPTGRDVAALVRFLVLARPMPPTRLSAARSESDLRVVRLLGLLLVDALETTAKGRRARGTRAARDWMCAASGDAPYSFEQACAAFGLPADALRRRVGLRRQRTPRRSARGWMRRPNR